MYHKVWRTTVLKNALAPYCINSTQNSFQIFSARRSFTIQLKQRVDAIAKELNIKQPSDWYKVSSKYLQDKLGNTFSEHYHSSSYKLLASVYPEYEWLAWKFDAVPRNFWADMDNQRKYVNWVQKELNIKEMSDWYNVSYNDLTDLHGQAFLHHHYSYSLYNMLCQVFPDYEWKPWKFDFVPRNFWANVENQRTYMDWAGKELKIKEMSDWYKVTLAATRLLQNKSSSLYKVLSAVYPEYEWLPWKFSNCPRNFWDDVENQRKYMDWAGKELKIKEMKDWYNLSLQDLYNLGGKTLLHGGSPGKILCAVYPEYPWLPWKMPRSKYSFWSDPNSWKPLIHYIENKLNIKDLSDWYNIKSEQLIELDGGILLVMNHSLSRILSLVYPDYKWNKESFVSSVDIHTDEYLSKFFVDYLKKQPANEIFYVYKVFSKNKENNILSHMLKAAFPNYHWISTGAKKSQYMLKECLENIFKDYEVFEEFKHPDTVTELDYYIPDLKLAFEFQGKQHYQNVGVFHRAEPFDALETRDKTKEETCKDLGITLIKVPYWWDKKQSSLEATIYNVRPDLFQVKPHGKAIPLTSPTIENTVAKDTTNLPFMTATEWDDVSMEPKGWFMTEKYDGMRLYWNGTEFITRNGTKVKVPDSIMRQMPSSIALDGELWTQYGLYQDAVTLCGTTNEDKWNKAVFWVFDVPQLTDKPIEERIEYLNQLQLPSFAKVIEFVKCEGKEHLKQFSDSILSKGGEGVILREPHSLYKRGRSSSLRKFKPFYDSEVKVIKNQYPHGLLCEQPNGKTIFVNTTENNLDAKQIKSGSVVTVKHQGTNVHGTLQYPQFYRERMDVNWNDLLNKVM